VGERWGVGVELEGAYEQRDEHAERKYNWSRARRENI
jgi:hypothetical protein